jgi:hypothetical protein
MQKGSSIEAGFGVFMHAVVRKMLIPFQNGRCVWPGFISYISDRHPTLLHRYGWVDDSDTYDDFADSISTDNGRTWSEPVMRLKSRSVEGGRMRYAENAALFDPSVSRLITLVSRGFYPDGAEPENIRWSLQFQEYDPAADYWSEPQIVNFSLPEGISVSFCFPIRTSTGAILVPATKPILDEQGRDVHLPGYDCRLEESLVLIGNRNQNGALEWKLGAPANIDPQKSSRGLSEPTIAELSDGRIVMICRGDNGYFPDRPGCKWVSFSKDGGRSWCDPQPLMLASGELIESSATGSALIRSAANGKLYYLANLCIAGERPNGNAPRSPLVLAEVRESPFALKPESFIIVDRRRPEDTPCVQMSNFRYYQDRRTGELCVRLTRLYEHRADNWKDADYHEYRIKLD